jgi:hypothetical protein
LRALADSKIALDRLKFLHKMKTPQRLSSVFASALFCYAFYWSIRLAYADHIAHGGSRAALEHAIRLAPGNPGYYVRLAVADPASALSLMARAAALNPLNASLWLEFGRLAEEENDFSKAEYCLLRAVALDKTFAPRWLLAEYYFRRHDQTHFWSAMRAALATSYDDVSPLFDLCWTLAFQPEVILQQAMPDRTDVLRQYLDFVLAKNRMDIARPVALKVVERADRDAVPSLLSYCDRLLENAHISAALEVWNSLANQRLIPFPALSPKRGNSITNGDFAEPFLSHAFDWHMASLEGVSAYEARAPWGVNITFSGKQPENCELLSQFLPLESDRQYRLRVRYSTDDLNGDTGLAWHVLNPLTGADLLQDSGHLMASQRQDKEQQLMFSSPQNTQLARLVLTYQRVVGTVRIIGSLSLHQVALGFAE